LRLHNAGIDPISIDSIICTHMHVDHVSDAGVLVEAMTGYTFKKRGLLIAPPSVLDGDRYGDKSISTYHQTLPAHVERFASDDEKTFEVHGEKPKTGLSSSSPILGSFSLRGVAVKHDTESGFGFIMELDGLKIGYTSDTEYLPSLHNSAFAGVDVLIANNLKSNKDSIPDHMHSGHLIQLLKSAKPKCCILSHMGMGLITSGPELEAARIQSESGVPTSAGRDGYSFDIERRVWSKADLKSKIEKTGEKSTKKAPAQKKLVD